MMNLESTRILFFKYRYFILSLLLLILAVINLLIGGRIPTEDIWEHAAVIRELATHPYSPTHPRFLLAVPHAFFSPYALGLALIVRITGLSPITILCVFTFINIFLFLISFRLFIKSLLKNEPVTFYALFFILFFWGLDPWVWSSFLHLRAFLRLSSYPSFFCIALTFVSFYLYIRILNSNCKAWFLCLLIIAVIVLLTHPPTAIFLYIGLVALSIGYHNHPHHSNHYLLAIIIILSIIIASFWPYYPFLKLLSSKSEYDASNYILYKNIFIKIFPILIGLPIVALRLISHILDPLGLMLIGLSSFYIYGGISHNYILGRVISFIAVVIQICLADWVAKKESKLILGEYSHSLKQVAFIIGIICLFFIMIIRIAAFEYSYIKNWRINHWYEEIANITEYFNQYDVILSDIKTSWIIPAYNGKIVAGLHPQPFVSDHEKRKDDLDLFFSERTNNEQRKNIIKKYKINYVLLNQDEVRLSKDMVNPYCSLGEIIYSKGDYLLIKVNLCSYL